MSEKPKSKYNYQATSEIHYQKGSAVNIHICINGVGDTKEAAIELFDHALKETLFIMRDAGVDLGDE